MEQLTVEMCAFPGCERPVAPAPEGAGRPSRYCELAEHNAQTAFRERRRREAAGESDIARASGRVAIVLSASPARRCARSLCGSRGIWSARARRSRC